MREWLVFFTEHAITLIDALALVIAVFATLEAFVGACASRSRRRTSTNAATSGCATHAGSSRR